MYYVAHRLFALHDRALGTLVAAELARHAGDENVFLPFCDTDEENLVADCKGRRLFELDRDRLDRLTGMIAIVHGPSLDDGVCMEIGYARQRGVPVVVLTTDFQTYGPTPDGPRFAFPDPLLEFAADRLIRVHRLATTTNHSPAAGRFEAFQRRNTEPLQQAARDAVTAVLTIATSATTESPHIDAAHAERLVLLEPSPYQPPHGWDHLAGHLQARDWQVHQTGRLAAGPAHSRADLLAAARTDWDQLARAGLLIADINGPETPPGAALMIGASAAVRRPILALYRGTSYTFADGREPNFRNLMIQYAITNRAADLQQLYRLLPA